MTVIYLNENQIKRKEVFPKLTRLDQLIDYMHSRIEELEYKFSTLDAAEYRFGADNRIDAQISELEHLIEVARKLR